MWKDEPESFIENEDENYFISEYDLDSECSTSLLAFQFLEKLISAFYNTCYQYISEDLLSSYLNSQVSLPNEMVEDALFSMAGMLGKIQKDLKIAPEKRLDIAYILDFLVAHKWQNPLFKRRFTHILSQWAKLLPKAKFFHYFSQVVASLREVTDFVLIYEHCHCLHEMVKELDLWIKKGQ